MYHSILKDPSRANSYTISPNTLENDLQYLKDRGYETITMNELISYVYEDYELPKKPIIITFDDGYYNNLEYAVPLLKKYHMKAVISVVGQYTDNSTSLDEANPNYSYLRWKDIKTLIEDNTSTIEFQNHSYNLHQHSGGRSGSMKKQGENNDSYHLLLSKDLLKLQEQFEKQTSYQPNTYTYPFGGISRGSTNIIKELGFKASLSCNSGINHISKDPNCLYLLKRNNRPSYMTSEQFFHKLLNS